MAFRSGIFAMHTLEVMFFTGVKVCAVTVILSWVSVGVGCFKDKN